MKDLKVSAGVWYLGATSDRFVKEGYRQDLTTEERFKLAALIEGVCGLEWECPDPRREKVLAVDAADAQGNAKREHISRFADRLHRTS